MYNYIYQLFLNKVWGKKNAPGTVQDRAAAGAVIAGAGTPGEVWISWVSMSHVKTKLCRQREPVDAEDLERPPERTRDAIKDTRKVCPLTCCCHCFLLPEAWLLFSPVYLLTTHLYLEGTCDRTKLLGW